MLKKISVIIALLSCIHAAYISTPHEFAVKERVSSSKINADFAAYESGLSQGTKDINVGNILINGNTFVDSNRDLTLGEATITGDITVEGDITTEGSIQATGDLTINGDLTVGGTFTQTELIITTVNTSEVSCNTINQNPLTFYYYDNLYAQNLINANFDIWQRVNNAANPSEQFEDPANGQYTADRWRVVNVDAFAPQVTVSRNTYILPSNNKSSKGIELSITNAGTAGDAVEWAIQQSVEEYTKFRGKYLSVGFQGMSEVDGEIIEVVVYDGVTTTNVSRETLSTTYNRYLFENIPISESATILTVGLRIAGGTSNTSPATSNFVPSSTGSIYISQIQCNVGTTTMDFLPKKYSQELQDCYRYYYRHARVTFPGGEASLCPIGRYSTTDDKASFYFKTPTRMRTPIVVTQKGLTVSKITTPLTSSDVLAISAQYNSEYNVGDNNLYLIVLPDQTFTNQEPLTLEDKNILGYLTLDAEI